MSLQPIQSSAGQWASYQSAAPVQNRTTTPPDEMSAVQQSAPVTSAVPQQTVAAPSSPKVPIDTMSDEELVSWLSEEMTVMATAAPVAAPTRSSSSSLVDLYKLDNKYYYGTSGNTWARIDENGDGVWSQSELTAYADAYKNATGKTLDVAAMIEEYGARDSSNNLITNADGEYIINATDQLRMYQDDALGISYAKDALILAEYNSTPSTGGSGSSGSSAVNQKAFNDFVNKYTYGSSGNLYAKIDQNEDGVWRLDELTEYAKAYEKATGVKLDVEALMAKYDKEGKGYLNYSDQNAMRKDDALGLSRISDMMDTAKAEEKSPAKDPGLSDKIKDSLNSLSSSSLRKVASAFNKSIQQAALLDAFTMTNMVVNRAYGRGNIGTYSMWNMASLSMASMFI